MRIYESKVEEKDPDQRDKLRIHQLMSSSFSMKLDEFSYVYKGVSVDR